MILPLILFALAAVYLLAFALCRAAGRKRAECERLDSEAVAWADPGYPESRVRLPRARRAR